MRPFPALAELLAEPKLAALILDPAPALVFDPEGNLRFANRSALSAYGAATLSELMEKSASLFGEMPDTAREFAETLPLNGLYRREAIALANDTETFRCERIGLANGAEAVLFTGLARERFDGNVGKAFGVLFDGERAPFALFDHDGNPLHANNLASAIMGPAGTLTHLHASAASALSDARLKGAAEIPFGVLKIFLKKLSLGSHSVLFASFGQPERAAAEPAAEPRSEEFKAEPKNDAAAMASTATANDNVGWEVPPVQAASETPEQTEDEQSEDEDAERDATREALTAENTIEASAQETAKTAATAEPLPALREEPSHEAAKDRRRRGNLSCRQNRRSAATRRSSATRRHQATRSGEGRSRGAGLSGGNGDKRTAARNRETSARVRKGRSSGARSARNGTCAGYGRSNTHSTHRFADQTRTLALRLAGRCGRPLHEYFRRSRRRRRRGASGPRRRRLGRTCRAREHREYRCAACGGQTPRHLVRRFGALAGGRHGDRAPRSISPRSLCSIAIATSLAIAASVFSAKRFPSSQKQNL
jgi:hypothetical protein